MKLCLFLLALPLAAQSYNVGGPEVGTYFSDTVCGGTSYGPKQQGDLAKQPGVYQTLKYAQAFSCDIPVSIGTCIVQLLFLENRPAGPTPATQSAIGTRVFTVTSPGTSTTIDIFALAGAQAPFQLALPPIQVTDGHLRLQFTAARGNASLAGLEISCQPPPVAMVPCPSVPANTILPSLGSTQVYRAQAVSSSVVGCIPGSDALTVVTDAQANPVGVFVPWITQ